MLFSSNQMHLFWNIGVVVIIIIILSYIIHYIHFKYQIYLQKSNSAFQNTKNEDLFSFPVTYPNGNRLTSNDHGIINEIISIKKTPFVYWLGTTPCVVVSDPVSVKTILESPSDYGPGMHNSLMHSLCIVNYILT